MANHYDYPASGMKVIAVTGTNGKTTTCFMIYNILLKAGYRVGLMSTVANAIDGEVTQQSAHMTTADARTLNKRLAKMRDAGIQYLVLETSSHALAQHRIFGVPIDIAVVTNVTPEHLDYHRTFARYRAAKVKLFKLAASNAKHGGRGVGIANADDPSCKYFTSQVPLPITYGIKSGDLKATRVKLETKGVEYYTKLDKQTFHIKTRIPGEFNVYNSLAAVAATHALGLSKKQIEDGIYDLAGVEGRMNRIDEGQDFDVIIDFAHTPDAYEKLLPGIKKVAKGRVITLFGGAGERDQEKLPTMGKIAAENSDIVILTEDDPRGPVRPQSEKLAKGAIEAGKKEDKDLFYIDDRTEAIEFAVKTAQKGDTVVLMGKGHEKTIARATGDEPWNEAEVAREAILKVIGREDSDEAREIEADLEAKGVEPKNSSGVETNESNDVAQKARKDNKANADSKDATTKPAKSAKAAKATKVTKTARKTVKSTKNVKSKKVNKK